MAFDKEFFLKKAKENYDLGLLEYAQPKSSDNYELSQKKALMYFGNAVRAYEAAEEKSPNDLYVMLAVLMLKYEPDEIMQIKKYLVKPANEGHVGACFILAELLSSLSTEYQDIKIQKNDVAAQKWYFDAIGYPGANEKWKELTKYLKQKTGV